MSYDYDVKIERSDDTVGIRTTRYGGRLTWDEAERQADWYRTNDPLVVNAEVINAQ